MGSDYERLKASIEHLHAGLPPEFDHDLAQEIAQEVRRLVTEWADAHPRKVGRHRDVVVSKPTEEQVNSMVFEFSSCIWFRRTVPSMMPTEHLHVRKGLRSISDNFQEVGGLLRDRRIFDRLVFLLQHTNPDLPRPDYRDVQNFIIGLDKELSAISNAIDRDESQSPTVPDARGSSNPDGKAVLDRLMRIFYDCIGRWPFSGSGPDATMLRDLIIVAGCEAPETTVYGNVLNACQGKPVWEKPYKYTPKKKLR